MAKEQMLVVYEIEKIISRRPGVNGTEYNIKWKNYSEEDNTWEPMGNLIADGASDLVYVFELTCQDEPDHDVEEFMRKYKLAKANMVSNQKDSDEEMEESWMNNMGSLPKDSIKKIIKLEKHSQSQIIYALVEWNARSIDGIKPKESFVQSSKLKKYCLQKYLDFLEGMMYTDK